MVMGSKARWTAREVGKGVGRHWPFLPIHQFLREYMGCQLAVSFQLAHCTDHLLTAQIMGILGYVPKKDAPSRNLPDTLPQTLAKRFCGCDRFLGYETVSFLVDSA